MKDKACITYTYLEMTNAFKGLWKFFCQLNMKFKFPFLLYI